MCGRFVRVQKPSVYATLFEVDSVPAGPSYNVAPTQAVAAVRMGENGRECVLLRWGLIPFWSKDGKQNYINARAETIIDKPAFRAALNKRRCLVPADGYYEWRTEGKQKQPYYFHRRDGEPIAFAGLWDRWQGPDDPVESCTLITTDANDVARPIHDRMPVILPQDAWRVWLDPEVDRAALKSLLKSFAADGMECCAVSPFVNNARNNGPECLQRLA